MSLIYPSIQSALPKPWEEEASFGDVLYDWMDRAPWMAISVAAHLLVYFIAAAIPWNDVFREDAVEIQAKIEQALTEVMDLTPRGIRNHLQLNKPIYERAAAYGHFGREPESDGGFSWEKVDLVDAVRSAVS